MALAWANRASAAVELRAGDAARAANHALASAAAADEAGAPVEAALARTLAGLALAQTDERDAPQPSCNTPPERSSAAGHSATGMRRNVSCAGSATGSTGARDRAQPMGLALNR
jgi:hypothetical protein